MTLEYDWILLWSPTLTLCHWDFLWGARRLAEREAAYRGPWTASLQQQWGIQKDWRDGGEDKKMNIKRRACCWPCKSASHWCGLTHSLSCIYEYVSLQMYKEKCVPCAEHAHLQKHKHTQNTNTDWHRHYTVMCVWIPAMCVTVAVNMALTGTAGGWTLQHILMHGQNWGEDNTHTHTQSLGH